MATYANYEYKVMYCRNDLCNAPEKVTALKKAILCEDGFYA